MGTLVLAAEEFTPPGASLFEYPPIFGSVTKPMVLAVLSLVIIVAVFTLGTRKLSLVPSKGQFALESFYDIPRNTMARDQIGSQDFKRFIPLILGLFSFILVNNLFAIVPVIQFPTLSRIGFPLSLALFVYVFYHYAGFKKHGFAGYIKHAALPPGVPVFIAPLIIVIELLQKFVVQPLSLALRVFAAMFAGHLIIALTAVASAFLITAGGALVIAGPFAFVAGIAFTFLEALVQVIQAYVFALLAAVFIGAAISEDH
ncbi:ATP synthase F0 subcomplex A subunit [Pseudonocardia sediminis]|uniref:ATP synthase subunit a n=1 Tax=Pseudonocardia sediminis TaxID=1397368 RepID=A0A4Q7V3L2_PSEST|nr:F0F1 ATP synthase subunit A [Pseudonocardia sediminis]RZT88064.1 ATP synthase F0 subcomplex A subunit [Pseudonocardia sediminis]